MKLLYYDANSNLTLVSREGAADESATFDAQDKMTSQGSKSFAYNQNGELTQKSTGGTPTATFGYSSSGQLKSAEVGSDTITYRYDALGNRTRTRVNGTTTQAFLYAPGILGPVAQLAEGSSQATSYVYGSRSNVPDLMIRGPLTYRIITDQLGSVRMVVNAATGAVAQEIEYDPFGEVISDSNPGFQPFGFAGGLYDNQTGLTHFGAREYDAALGRWTSRDPISFAGGDSNLYGYVVQDPVNFVDPSGLLVPWDRVTPPLVRDIGDAANAGVRAIGNAAEYTLQSAGDFSAGFAAAYDQGLSKWARQQLGTDDNVDTCSGWYSIGNGLGSVVWFAAQTFSPIGPGSLIGQLPIRAIKWIKPAVRARRVVPKSPLPPKGPANHPPIAIN